MTFLRQATAGQVICLGPFLSTTDGNTEMTALSIANTDILLHKMGGASMAAKNSGGATHLSGGLYQCTLDATDTATVGRLVIVCHPTGAIAYKDVYEVLPAAMYDALFTASNLGNLPALAAEIVALRVGYSLSGMTFDARGNLLTVTLTTSTGNSYAMVSTYDSTTGRLLTCVWSVVV